MDMILSTGLFTHSCDTRLRCSTIFSARSPSGHVCIFFIVIGFCAPFRWRVVANGEKQIVKKHPEICLRLKASASLTIQSVLRLCSSGGRRFHWNIL